MIKLSENPIENPQKKEQCATGYHYEVADNGKRVIRPNNMQDIQFNTFKTMLVNNPFLKPVDIVMTVYRCKDRHSARNIANNNLKKLGITMKEILERQGLTDERDAKDLIKLRKAKTWKQVGKNLWKQENDSIIQLKSLELTRRLKGDFDKDTTIDNRQIHITVSKEDEDSLQRIADGLNEMNRQLQLKPDDGVVQFKEPISDGETVEST